MINILHLYYDILNLYGENANPRAIVNELKRSKIKTKIDFKSINDKIDFTKYDIVYIGSGSEESLFIVLEDILKREKELKSYIEDDKYLFLTGNSMNLFGKYIENFDGDKKDALSIFNYHTVLSDKLLFNNEASVDRIVGEVIASSKLIDKTIVGFQNRCDRVHNVKTPFLKVKKNYSNDENSTNEGFNYKNVYATHLIGPLFIRNPYLTDYFLKKICESKKLNYVINEKDTAKKAYKKYLENFVN